MSDTAQLNIDTGAKGTRTKNPDPEAALRAAVDAAAKDSAAADLALAKATEALDAADAKVRAAEAAFEAGDAGEAAWAEVQGVRADKERVALIYRAADAKASRATEARHAAEHALLRHRYAGAKAAAGEDAYLAAIAPELERALGAYRALADANARMLALEASHNARVRAAADLAKQLRVTPPAPVAQGRSFYLARRAVCEANVEHWTAVDGNAELVPAGGRWATSWLLRPVPADHRLSDMAHDSPAETELLARLANGGGEG